MEFDILIRNGRVIDGAGNPWYRADIGVKDSKIYAIGKLGKADAKKTIDASGHFVSPGFIDAHSHSDFNTLVYRDMENIIHQGITTVVAGQCGSSPAPVSDLIRAEAQRSLDSELPQGIKLKISWSSFDDYLKEEKKQGLGANVAHMVGHGAIRAAAIGYAARAPTADELEKMREYTAEAMKSGAYGISTGLIYPPGIYAKTDEIIEVAKVAAQYGGIYDSHIRGEGKTLMMALEEALEIGYKAKIPVQISHHKIASRTLWGSSVQTMQMFEEAREKGLDVTVDQYPYKAGSTSLMTLLPPWVHDGGREKALERLRDPQLRARMKKEIEEGIEGWENFAGELGWENVFVTSVITDANKPVEGMNMTEIKKHRGAKDEFTALYELLLEEEGAPGMVIFYGDEEDVKRIMKHPLHMVGTDAGCCTIEGPFCKGKPHPRHYGTYPKILGKYVREEKTITWQEAVRKMTSFPAQRFGILDRGLLRPGMWADITVFNPETVIDRATYKDPHNFPAGIPYVIVNGEITISEGKYSKSRAGTTLRKPVY
ncbi:D-aminoacylase [Candidatus Bathyarchaeota archaeon]|nr:MAG: D-aminoacylase [Candidatus Bathyarchaeota archaeon]